MRLPHTSVSVLCPVCRSADVFTCDQDRTAWTLYALTLRCQTCAATFTAHYECYAVRDVTYGTPIGPVCLTDFPQQALVAWEADERQWILTNGTAYAIGYAPTVLADGRGSADGWRETSPEALGALLAA